MRDNPDAERSTPDDPGKAGGVPQTPTIALPKGGGAIRGIGENFAANPVTGTGSMTVPIATSPGRSGFGPQLSLSYDSGAGNGPFGFGWTLSLPAITRRTDRGLPQYDDDAASESDVFLLSGAEDLVPEFERDADGGWVTQNGHFVLFNKTRTVGGVVYRIRRYRPRIEGLFARIERWTNTADRSDVRWRSISKDNITTWYGATADSRIADPGNPAHIFGWLICQTYDSNGNVIAYGYKKENSDKVDLTRVQERNRTDATRSANRYIKRIRYGNKTSYLPKLSPATPLPTPPGDTAADGSKDWLFELVFDYGEHDDQAPVPQEVRQWSCRDDPFSAYRATFEVRTYRLCRRALMFHHFPDEPGVGPNCLVRSTDLTHTLLAQQQDPAGPFYAFLRAVTHTGRRRRVDGTYLSKALPPLEFVYTDAVIDDAVQDVDEESLRNLPAGLGRQYQWVDLDGEGLSGILSEQAGNWFYKPNLSPANVTLENGVRSTRAQFGPVQSVLHRPSLAALGSGQQQLLDLAADGQLDLVSFGGSAPGFFERTQDGDWAPFTPFTALPDLDWNDPNLKFIDLTGDGHADLLLTEDIALCWHPSLAQAGFAEAQRVPQALDEEKGPRLVFADETESLFLADLSADGLSDLVRIRNGEVCYWPNLGYGRFGAKVTMDHSPWFEAPDLFDSRRIRLMDIDGCGTADIVYFASGGVHLYFNQSGNAWCARRVLREFPPVDSVASAAVLDLLGNGTACLVWSSPLTGDVRRSMRYIDLMGGQKPHLLIQVTNNLGADTYVHYAPSTKFYVADKLAGNPWITRLPFPVHVVERVETFDYVSRNRFVTQYAYHHGFYDGIEREFRGFGMVEQFDSELIGEGPGLGAGSYRFSTIDVPGATSTFLSAINNKGQIVGALRDANGVRHSVLVDAGAFNSFDPPGFTNTTFPGISAAAGINDAGDIVGDVVNNDNAGSQAYIRSNHGFSFYTHPDADPTRGTSFTAINNAGVRVGAFTDTSGIPHGIIQTGNGTVRLEDVAAMPANTGTFIFDINNSGQMVGSYFDPVSDVQHGFLFDGKSVTTIDFPGSSTTWLNSINDLGQMAGSYFDDAGQKWHGLLTNGRTFVVVDVPAAPGQAVPDTFLSSIDNAARVVGMSGDLGHLNRPGIHGFLATPVPGNARLSAPISQQHSSPPTCTKTWFHTGAYLGEERISKHFEDEYYDEGDASDAIAGLPSAQREAMLLEDTVLPTALRLLNGSRIPYQLTTDERREAARALKGSILRQEISALDGTDAADRPYSASERNYTIETLQPQDTNRHAVFFVHARETVDFHYERKLYKVTDGILVDPSNPPARSTNAADPRVTHAFTLAADVFGNVLQSVAVGYRRRYEDPALTVPDRAKQITSLFTCSESAYTNAIVDQNDAYHTPLPSEVRTYELIQVQADPSWSDPPPPDLTNLYRFDHMQQQVEQSAQHELPYEDWLHTGAVTGVPNRRLIETAQTRYRPDDLGSAANDIHALLPLGTLESLAVSGEMYTLAFTPGLLASVYVRDGEALLPIPANVLGSIHFDGGGYVDLEGDGRWWIPSGRVFYDPDPRATPQQELEQARAHFFLPRRVEDPFGKNSVVDYDPHDLLVVRTKDAVANVVAAGNDYRVLQPTLVTDPNGNRAAVSFDVLGLVAGNAVMGKIQEGVGDSLDTFVPDLSVQQIDDFLSADDPHTVAVSLLGTATTRIVYDVDRFQTTRAANPSDPTQWEPVFAATLARETHSNDPLPPGGLKIQISFSYSDGFGREIQKKIQAEPGPAIEGGPLINPRWVGSGWTIFNNKGKPVRQYEPFFSQLPTKGHHFEFGVTFGVSPIFCYDPVQRVVATIHPNHTYEKVVFDPWRQETWDVNDTVTIDPRTDSDVGSFFTLLPDGDYLPTWYTRRIDGALPDEQDAAKKAASHTNTPGIAHFDTLGRTCLTIAHNRFQRDGMPVDESYPTRILLDIEGNHRQVRDAVVQAGDAQGRIVMLYDYDMLGNSIHQSSMEAGERWALNDVTGKTIRAWDSRGHAFRTAYDPLRRQIEAFVQGTDQRNPGTEILLDRTVYGEGQVEDLRLNLRSRVFQRFDSAGVVTNESYDFKGNILRASREVAQDYKGPIDWTAAQPPGEVFSTSTTYDAVNRPTAITTPDRSVYRPTYNDANMLDKVDVTLRGAATETPFVTDIVYDAKGQRVRIDHATRNGIPLSTVYSYDLDTFRLVQLTTQRGSATAQDLRYTYDPAGNVTRIRDAAQQALYFTNQVVGADSDYTYDAVYRLIEANGREHIGQLTQPETTWDDEFRTHLPHPQDGQSMRNYTEQYEYDAVGNFETLRHLAVNGRWTRRYAYNEPSLLEPAKTSSRLSGTTVGRATGDLPEESYGYDVHGNLTHMPHLPSMQWDFRDQLHSTVRQVVNRGTPETTYYVYDTEGRRVRKVTERQGGLRKDERIYCAGFEVYREYDSTGSAVTVERETLHVMDDKQRVALVETKTITDPNDRSPTQLIRYQFANHLGSAALELDDQADVISYEEYYPYGCTSYQAVNGDIKPAAKRYRYTAKERDEETGFSYHGARYCAPWLGRWISCDPAGLRDGSNRYYYARCNPAGWRDATGASSDPAQMGDIKPYNRQGRAIRDEDNIRLSEHEHIRARINLWLQTHDPASGGSAYGRPEYRRSVTLTIPEDMARVKTAMDMALRDRLRDALRTGVVSNQLIAEMQIEADITRTIVARNQTLAARLAENKPIADLLAITDERIAIAAHYQQGELFEGGKRQRVPAQVTAATDREIDAAVSSLQPHPTQAPPPPQEQVRTAPPPADSPTRASTAPTPPTPTPKPDPSPVPSEGAPVARRAAAAASIAAEKAVFVIAVGQANSHEEAAAEFAKYFLAGLALTKVGVPGWYAMLVGATVAAAPHYAEAVSKEREALRRMDPKLDTPLHIKPMP